MLESDWYDEKEEDDHYERNEEQHHYYCEKCNKEYDEDELEDFDGENVCDNCLGILKDKYTEKIRSLFEELIDDHLTLKGYKNTTGSELEDNFDEYIDRIKKELF